jgi:class 3 adenylate cyclase
MESASRTLVCSVVFLDIANYSRKPVAEQLQLKQAFNRVLAGALQGVAARDRVVLDTGDGAAITFLGDPEDALFAAMSMRDALQGAQGGLAARIGVNLGPVRLVRDLNSQVNIIGDGINVAQRVMSFADPGQLLVSRSFYEVVSCLSRDYAALFTHEGSRTDKHVREHEVYSVRAALPRRAAQPAPEASARRGLLGALVAPGPLGLNRSTYVVAPLVFLLLVAFANGAKNRREQREAAARAAALASPSPAPVIQRPVPLPRFDKALPPKAERQASAPAPSAERPAAASATGQVVVGVLPWGEVFVNGRSRGVSPPLRVLELPPGAHTIEIRNASFPPYVERVQVRAGEQVRVKHRFQ